MIGSDEPINLGNDTLGEMILARLVSKKDKNIEFMIDLKKNVRLTYQDLLDYSVRLTTSLENLGVKQNDILGIFSENCWESVVTTIAAWNIGASVALINPNFIKSELYHALKTEEPKFLFTTRNRLPLLEENISSIEEIILFDECSKNSAGLDFQSLLLENKMSYQDYKPKQFDPEKTVACIMLSSGTTAVPKAVMLTHNNLKWCFTYLGDPNTLNFNSNTRTLLYLPLFHIMGLMVLLGTLYDGEKLVIMDKFKPEEFLRTVETYKISYLVVVPPTLQFLAKNPLVLEHDLSSVKQIMCGGAPASKEIEVDVTNRLPRAKVRQLYGMTEVTGPVTSVPLNENRPGSVGRIIEGINMKIINPDTNEMLGPNNRGEICIKGPAVMKGYMKNSEETKNCIDSDGFMHSGDIGFYDTNGFIFVVDRIKELIKYKAFQVAPAELEGTIIKHKAVKDVGIVGKPDDRCGELPTAFIVIQPGEHVTERDIYDYVADNFSHEKHLYGGVYFVDEIPKTSSGKILRKELRKLLGDS